MITYPEFSRTAAEKLGCKMATIDLSGAITYQGPVTPPQQAALMEVFSKVSKENEELLKQLPVKMGEAQKDAKERSEKAKAKAKATKK